MIRTSCYVASRMCLRWLTSRMSPNFNLLNFSKLQTGDWHCIWTEFARVQKIFEYFEVVLHETEPQIVMALTGTGWTTWRTCVRRSWWRGWRPPTQLIFSGLFYHNLKQAVPLFGGLTPLFHKNINKIPSLAHKYNAGPLKSFALAMISRNVEEVMTAFFISRNVNCTKSANNVWQGWKKEPKTKSAKKTQRAKKGDEDQGLEGVDPLRAGE